MPVTLYALFRRACNASFKPDGAPLADREREVEAVRRAVRLAKTGNWDGAAFTLYIAGDKIAGNHRPAEMARGAVGRLRSLARAARDIMGLPGHKDGDISRLAAASREDVTAVVGLIDALEEGGHALYRERIQTILDTYKELFHV